MNWRELVLRIMRVPPEPEPPPGSPPRTFRASPHFFTLRMIRWLVTQLPAVIGLLWALYFIHWIAAKDAPHSVILVLRGFEVFGWALFLFELAFGWMVVRLDYEMRWYMLSDRAIRIREGIVNIREKTIALANVQNIAVQQGPLQRLLGIADVEVKTAGGGGRVSEMERKKHGGREPMHVAYFRGVDNAETIRDLVREGVRVQRNTGLGDPEEPVLDAGTAMAELLSEARALRGKVTASPAVPPPA